MRLMYDSIHDNVRAIHAIAKPGDLIAGYVTGSPDIRWTPADFAVFADGTKFVHIDQGFTGSPVPSADVRDVEPNAWAAIDAIGRKPWDAPRPTIYCDRSDLSTVMAYGWTGDIWLAEPGPMPTIRPHLDNANIVAVQFGFHSEYDVSVVFDDNWPLMAPVPETLSATGHNGYANFGWSADDSAVKYELLVVGAGGKGSGTSHVDIQTTRTHEGHVILAPGWYIAHVRAFYGSGLIGTWSAAKKLLVSHP